MLREMVDWNGDWTPPGKRPVGMEINPSFGQESILIGQFNIIDIIVVQQYERCTNSSLVHRFFDNIIEQ